ncbi:ABC transporter ATP-binding protein [Pusillimonas caeni]|uniref:ABC transporter ATP-binding protein n=1 Tax=Pusillimonas caeni TaxID=1348472 RepID=UPI000E59F88D|nr:ABC transporter ATP-binding protein [Pusillimonas caeni]TFL14750.1 ABC transporter ATP-binding protein [Pusillimonas caeni]
MNGPILTTQRLRMKFGGLLATDDVSLSIERGRLHAIIGPNGAGKTTLLSLLSGELRPTAGSILLQGRDITPLGLAERVRRGVARSFQITSVLEEFTARDNVAVAVQASQGHSFRFWADARRDSALVDTADRLLEQVGLAHASNEMTGSLAHGARRQLELAIVLATRPSVLLLDEPMAGMSPVESVQMTRLLEQLKRQYTILLVEHDMSAVFALADEISVLVYGRVIATGSPEAIRGDESVRQAYLGEEA